MSRPSPAIAMLLLCLPIVRCHAQQRPPDTIASTQISTYETDPAADPARPTVTNPAHIPPPGYLQVEQGVLQANTTPGTGPDSQLSLVQTTKIALSHHLMVFAQSQPFAHSTTSNIHSNDTGDLDLGVQVVLLDEGEGHGRIPSVALAYSERVRSGTSPDLDAGSWSRSALFLASGNLPLGLHYDANVIFNQQTGDGYGLQAVPAGSGAGLLYTVTHEARRAQFGQTVSVTHGLTRKFALTVEMWRFSQPFQAGNAIGNLYTPSYTVRKTLVLDAGFSKGLTGTSTDWETFAGFTYLLPHRVWSFRRPGV